MTAELVAEVESQRADAETRLATVQAELKTAIQQSIDLDKAVLAGAETISAPAAEALKNKDAFAKTAPKKAEATAAEAAANAYVEPQWDGGYAEPDYGYVPPADNGWSGGGNNWTPPPANNNGGGGGGDWDPNGVGITAAPAKHPTPASSRTSNEPRLSPCKTPSQNSLTGI